MTKPPKGVIVGQHQVTVEIDGHTLDFCGSIRQRAPACGQRGDASRASLIPAVTFPRIFDPARGYLQIDPPLKRQLIDLDETQLQRLLSGVQRKTFAHFEVYRF